MDKALAYRAIIRYLAEDRAGFEALVGKPIPCRYYQDKNISIPAKINTFTGELKIGEKVYSWGRVSG